MEEGREKSKIEVARRLIESGMRKEEAAMIAMVSVEALGR